MNVSRRQIVARGLTNRCPNCGQRTLFKEGKLFEVNRSCTQCGLLIERDEGGFLGALALNYGVTLVGFLTPLMLLAYFKVIGFSFAIIAAGVGSLLFPALFYRSSRSWWLMNYYLVLPQHLPANLPEIPPGQDENI